MKGSLKNKRSIKARERLSKIKDKLELLNLEEDECYELGYRGKHHRVCLMQDGDAIAIGLTAIEEWLYWKKWFKTHDLEGNVK